MNLATKFVLTAAISMFCTAGAFGGEKATCHTTRADWHCVKTYNGCRFNCGKPHFHFVRRGRIHHVRSHHSMSSNYYDYGSGSAYVGGNYGGVEAQEYSPPPPLVPAPAAPLNDRAFDQAPPPPMPPIAPMPPDSPVFNFYGPTNNFFAPVTGYPFAFGGHAVPPVPYNRDSRLDPWHGYDRNDGLENGY